MIPLLPAPYQCQTHVRCYRTFICCVCVNSLLKQLWMGIWQHTHTVDTTEVSPDLGEFTEILDDVSALSLRL